MYIENQSIKTEMKNRYIIIKDIKTIINLFLINNSIIIKDGIRKTTQKDMREVDQEAKEVEVDTLKKKLVIHHHHTVVNLKTQLKREKIRGPLVNNLQAENKRTKWRQIITTGSIEEVHHQKENHKKNREKGQRKGLENNLVQKIGILSVHPDQNQK